MIIQFCIVLIIFSSFPLFLVPFHIGIEIDTICLLTKMRFIMNHLEQSIKIAIKDTEEGGDDFIEILSRFNLSNVRQYLYSEYSEQYAYGLIERVLDIKTLNHLGSGAN